MRLPATLLTVLLPTIVLAADCPRDSVRVGTTCVDRYEASLWRIPAASTSLLKKIRKGTITLADLATSDAQQTGPAKLEECSGDDHYNATISVAAAYSNHGFRCVR